MLAFQLNPETLRLAKAIGDDYVTYDYKGETKIFVYYEEDDTFEVMSMSKYREEYGLKVHFKATVFTPNRK